MDSTRVDEMIRELKKERDAVARPWDDAIASLERLRAHDGTKLVAPSTSRVKRDTDRSGRPRGIEAVRRVLMDAPGEMDVRQITEELIRREWAPLSADPVNATSSAASRLAQHNPAVIRRRSPSGSYFYRYENPASTFVRGGTAVDEAPPPNGSQPHAPEEDDPVLTEEDDPVLTE